jgi:hypothetical protein
LSCERAPPSGSVHAVPASWWANRGIMGKRNQVRVAVSDKKVITRRVARSVLAYSAHVTARLAKSVGVGKPRKQQLARQGTA